MRVPTIRQVLALPEHILRKVYAACGHSIIGTSGWVQFDAIPHYCCAQSGVELGIFIKEAMKEAGGVPFAQLPPEALCKALRKYETVRSCRVDYLITKSRNFGAAAFPKRSLLVRPCLTGGPEGTATPPWDWLLFW